ncbi:MAG: 50S ribosomal protein L23 [Cyanobacteria bacterium P01_D01_bin.36]
MSKKIDARDIPDIIRKPLITEKATIALENNQYTFEVAPKATKPQIKDAVEKLFDVKVVGISTQNPPRKKRRVGQFIGHRAAYKRAVVTLAPDDSITLFPDV